MEKLKNIDAILFDLMGVLLFQKNDYRPEPLVDEIDDLIGRVIDDNSFKQKMFKKFCFDESSFDKVIIKIVNKYEPFQRLWDLLPGMRKYYKLAIVNNGTTLTLPKLDQRLNFNKYFDLFISSAKEGTKKPGQDIFLIAAKRLNVIPERCLFMDNEKENIRGAKRTGMQAILWPNKDDGFKKFIELIGV